MLQALALAHYIKTQSRVNKSALDINLYYLHLPGELVGGGGGHEDVGDGEVVVDGNDNERVPGPKHTSQQDGHLLVS